MSNHEKNKALANDLKKFLEKNNIATDTRIYFNGIAYDGIDSNEYVIIEDIKGSNYFEYANDDTVSMSFEGALYHILNYGTNNKLLEKFDAIFEKHNCWYEFGYAWSLTVYYE